MPVSTTRACLFGGTLLAAGLGHTASAQEFIPTVPGGSDYLGYYSVSVSEGYDYQYSYGYAYSASEAFDWDFDFSTASGWRATASFSPTVARVSATTTTSTDTFPYAYATINAYFEVSQESTLRATWDIPLGSGDDDAEGRVQLLEASGGALLSEFIFDPDDPRTGDESFTLFPDTLYVMTIDATAFGAREVDAFIQFELLPLGDCRADLDGDGELTLFDFLAFQNLFDSGDLAADFDGDGSLTLFDFLAFQNEFDAGC